MFRTGAKIYLSKKNILRLGALHLAKYFRCVWMRSKPIRANILYLQPIRKSAHNLAYVRFPALDTGCNLYVICKPSWPGYVILRDEFCDKHVEHCVTKLRKNQPHLLHALLSFQKCCIREGSLPRSDTFQSLELLRSLFSAWTLCLWALFLFCYPALGRSACHSSSI